MASFVLSNQEQLVFDLTKDGNVESYLTVKNISDDALIFSIRTNSRINFYVKPTKFYLKPDQTKPIRFTLKEDTKRELLNSSVLRREKIEINAMKVSSIFIDMIENKPEEMNTIIRNRFKAAESDVSFKSCYVSEEEMKSGALGEVSEVMKSHLRIIYKKESDGADRIATSVAHTAEQVEQVEQVKQVKKSKTNETMTEVKQIPKTPLLMIAWSIIMIVVGVLLGYYRSN